MWITPFAMLVDADVDDEADASDATAQLVLMCCASNAGAGSRPAAINASDGALTATPWRTK